MWEIWEPQMGFSHFDQLKMVNVGNRRLNRALNFKWYTLSGQCRVSRISTRVLPTLSNGVENCIQCPDNVG